MRLAHSVIIAALLTGCAANPPDSLVSEAGFVGPSQLAEKASSGDAIEVASNTPAERTASKDGTDVVCRREPIPNTRLGSQRICMTREDWQRRADVASDAWREQQRPAMPESGD